MTAFSEIQGLLNKPFLLQWLAREHRDIFDTAYELYERPFKPRAKDESGHDLQWLRHYLEKLAHLEAQSQGFLALHEKVGEQSDYDLATDYLKRSIRYHGLAYIYGYAVLKMNRLPDGSLVSGQVEDFARESLQRIEKSAVNISDFAELAGAMKTAEARGWMGRANLRPIIVIGANWCPDTAVNVVEVANAFDVRLHLLFMDYLKDPRESGRRANGYFTSNDHAQANFEDGYKAYKALVSSDRARIPLVVYPDGVRDEEPKVTRFSTRLVQLGFI
jgi:hypothetical protein